MRRRRHAPGGVLVAHPASGAADRVKDARSASGGDQNTPNGEGRGGATPVVDAEPTAGLQGEAHAARHDSIVRRRGLFVWRSVPCVPRPPEGDRGDM